MKKCWNRNINTFVSGLILLGALVFLNQAQAQNAGSPLKTIIVDAGHGLPDPGAQGRYSNESDVALAIAKKLVQKLRDSIPNCKVLLTRTDRNLPGGLHDKGDANRWRAKFANQNNGDLFICIHCNDVPDVHHSRITGYRTKVYYRGKGKNRKRHTRKVPIRKYWTTPNPALGTETYVWNVTKNDSKQDFIQKNQDSTQLSGERMDDSGDYFTSSEERILATLRAKKYFSRSLLLAELLEGEYTKEGRISRGVKQRSVGIWVLHATAMPSILTEVGFISNPKEEDYMNSQSGQNEISGAILRAVLQYEHKLDSGVIPSSK